MSMREKIQSLIASHPTNFIKIEDDGTVRLAMNPTALTDSILDALMQPTPSVWREAMKDYESERPLYPEHGIKSAGQIPSWVLVETSWKALIKAIKEGN